MSAEQSLSELRRLFDAYVDSRHEFWGLVAVLSSVQKDYGADWVDRVNDVMQAMELDDAGLFPDVWFDELESVDEADGFEAYCDDRMGREP